MLRHAFALPLALWCACAPAQEKGPGWALKFKDYAVTDKFQGKPAPPVLATKDQRLFRTMIRQGAAKGPNFAGHYTIAEWGCGAGCVQAVLVDARTGRIYNLPFGSIALPLPAANGRESQGPVYQLGSRLFIADGCLNEEKCGTYYYEWKNGRFTLLRSDPQPQAKQ